MSGGNKSGYFFEISWQLIFTKVANIFRYFLGKFEKQLSLRETVVTTIWGTFEKMVCLLFQHQVKQWIRLSKSAIFCSLDVKVRYLKTLNFSLLLQGTNRYLGTNWLLCQTIIY